MHSSEWKLAQLLGLLLPNASNRLFKRLFQKYSMNVPIFIYLYIFVGYTPTYVSWLEIEQWGTYGLCIEFQLLILKTKQVF